MLHLLYAMMQQENGRCKHFMGHAALFGMPSGPKPQGHSSHGEVVSSQECKDGDDAILMEKLNSEHKDASANQHAAFNEHDARVPASSTPR